MLRQNTIIVVDGNEKKKTWPSTADSKIERNESEWRGGWGPTEENRVNRERQGDRKNQVSKLRISASDHWG